MVVCLFMTEEPPGWRRHYPLSKGWKGEETPSVQRGRAIFPGRVCRERDGRPACSTARTAAGRTAGTKAFFPAEALRRALPGQAKADEPQDPAQAPDETLPAGARGRDGKRPAGEKEPVWKEQGPV